MFKEQLGLEVRTVLSWFKTYLSYRNQKDKKVLRNQKLKNPLVPQNRLNQLKKEKAVKRVNRNRSRQNSKN